ncbi:radical SAM protein [Bosea sp. (in: a-proteobacteria)]|jgi:hypothetical protein|uniref:radical SAM protein n=1 Tax=Bosea sp. (in: a-proteobacteria) TaxID=1871050 RepID=UPI003569C2AA
MESIYWSITWACHRKCVHCYEDRFRPYVRNALGDVVGQTLQNWPRVLANLPDRMTYLDLEQPVAGGGWQERRGRIILSGGEVLIDPIREPALYPLLEALRERYAGRGGVNVVVQTTGDLLTEEIIRDLVARGVWMISVAGMDDFHVGMEGAKRDPLQQRLIGWFEAAGLQRSGLQHQTRRWHEEDGPLFSFFGATPDAWIGRLWPRGRAWKNGLSTATMADNFCNRWSGGLNFLNHRYSGSEVAIDAAGDVFPCCMKTKLPIGNLTEEPLEGMLDSLVGHPVYEAINAGHPERMGLAYGWDLDTYLAKAQTVQPKGSAYRNLCIGCDRFHEEVLGPVIARIRSERLARRHPLAAE